MPSFDRLIAAIAARQDRLVTHRNLLNLGMSEGAIQGRLASGRLVTVFPGVYLVGVAILDQDTLAGAALLVAGPGAVLAERTAAERYGLLEPQPGYVAIARPEGVDRSKFKSAISMPDGGLGLVRVRQASGLERDTAWSQEKPTMSVARTLIELAGRHSDFFDEAWRQAEYRGILHPSELGHVLAGGKRRGATLVRAKLADHIAVDVGPHGLDSPSELDAIKMVIAAGAPHPSVNHWITAGHRRRRIDLYWHLARLAVEIDGWQGHQSKASFEDDRLRDEDLLEMGILTQRFTVRRARSHPDQCAARILAQLRERTPSAGLVA